MKKADRVSSLIILGICTFFLIKARKFSPLSALFPRVIIYILAFLALLLFVSTFFRKGDDRAFDSAAFRHLPSILTAGLITAWVILIPVIGFLVTSLIIFPLITIYLDRGSSGKKIAGRLFLSLAIPLVLYFFFTQILYVPFPEGLLI